MAFDRVGGTEALLLIINRMLAFGLAFFKLILHFMGLYAYIGQWCCYTIQHVPKNAFIVVTTEIMTDDKALSGGAYV